MSKNCDETLSFDKTGERNQYIVYYMNCLKSEYNSGLDKAAIEDFNEIHDTTYGQRRDIEVCAGKRVSHDDVPIVVPAEWIWLPIGFCPSLRSLWNVRKGSPVVRMCLTMDKAYEEISFVKRQLHVMELRVLRVPLIWNYPFSEIRFYQNNRKPLTVAVTDFIVDWRPSVKIRKIGWDIGFHGRISGDQVGLPIFSVRIDRKFTNQHAAFSKSTPTSVVVGARRVVRVVCKAP